ncbi:PE family protein [Mycobacterium bourgelatii]|uniref:PE domain-containing protein n=1 Tax=Mycobacterium bourgelatii TaxID=1273442 RepID=A0A7I9YJL0_MYCBU|nr:PE family protein [Mycobacterium bourgelatii]MCV6973560.1 PE family protein [Mycobacterium bourgelatii]GFG88867.1 hypothetical protein MBOU_09090 [Mycobacterium bourgelatii]
MSYVIAVPQSVQAATTDLAAIGSAVDAARLKAATQTGILLPAAADEVSAGIAQLFAQHAAEYQQAAGQAAAFHEKFVQQLTATANAYANAEAANASLLAPKIAEAAPAAGTGIPWYDALNMAINNFIDSVLNQIFLFLFWPLWLPIAVSFLPFYIILSAFFPRAFPIEDFWKILFLPFLEGWTVT